MSAQPSEVSYDTLVILFIGEEDNPASLHQLDLFHMPLPTSAHFPPRHSQSSPATSQTSKSTSRDHLILTSETFHPFHEHVSKAQHIVFTRVAWMPSICSYLEHVHRRSALHHLQYIKVSFRFLIDNIRGVSSVFTRANQGS